MSAYVKKYNVTRKDDSTPGKTFWKKVGHLFEYSDGSMKLDLFVFPQMFNVFADSEEDRAERAKKRAGP